METQHLHAAKDIMRAAFVAIAEAGKPGLPSGHLYAKFMNLLTLQTYEKMIKLMKELNLIEKRGDLLFIKEEEKLRQ
jgi:hypothetical protein